MYALQGSTHGRVGKVDKRGKMGILKDVDMETL